MPHNRPSKQFSNIDTQFMAHAHALANSVKGNTFPNPSVGAVLVKNGKIIGVGATAPYGGPHAEINAIEMAGDKAKGSTLYVSLEPCCHFGKTPPCTNAVISAGITTVYASSIDPNPLVRGKGMRILKKNGITVYTGLLANEADSINEDFFYWVKNKRPWVSVKLAMTLDGRIADSYGNSKWITSNASRTFVHDLRRRHASIAIGRKTLVADDPKLTVRHGFSAKPARIVFSSTPDLPRESYFVSSVKKQRAPAPRSICVVRGGAKRSITVLQNGIELWRTGCKDAGAGLKAFLAMAYEENICSVFIEGGSRLASSFIEHDLVNRVYLFYGNKVLGNGIPGIHFKSLHRIENALSLKNITMRQFDDDMMITGLLKEK